MRNSRRLICIIVVVLFFPGFAGMANVQSEYIKDLGGKSHIKRVRLIFELHKMGKAAIPLLIENITNEKEVVAPLNEPRSSRMGTSRCYIGRLSAYIIEMILGREKLIELKYPEDFEYVLGPYPGNYIYGVGIITKEQGKLIAAKDLVHVQKIYMDWWEKSKDKSIEELRRNWSRGITPLSQSRFSWE